MLDLGQLLPHGKKDAKLDTKSERGAINEVAPSRYWTQFRRGATSSSSSNNAHSHVECVPVLVDALRLGVAPLPS